MKYTPKINDYVHFRSVEGWVYFVTDEYLTIEISVKPKPECELTRHSKHKMTHCLIVCYSHNWNELRYTHSRRYANASNLDDMEIYVREFQ